MAKQSRRSQLHIRRIRGIYEAPAALKLLSYYAKVLPGLDAR
jgi:hypothetical protein